MRLSTLHIALRSVRHYRTSTIYQVLIILALSSIITGSLLTGRSVRKSLAETNINKLYGTAYYISAGNKYFPYSLSDRIEKRTGNGIEGILQTGGWASNFSTGTSALDIQVYGVRDSFFQFNGKVDSLQMNKGEVVINSKLASKLGVNIRDEIVIRFPDPSDIPAESPFTPEEDAYESLNVVSILDETGPENFSLGISQAEPLNIFISLEEFKDYFNESEKINRILIHSDLKLSVSEMEEILSDSFDFEDAGFYTRFSETASQYEILSDRIFITDKESSLITGLVPGSGPVMTYLVNSLETDKSSTPYSFVSALPGELFRNVPDSTQVIINDWLAEDLGAGKGDSLRFTYYTMGPYKTLQEKDHIFVISDIIAMDDEWSDPQLMPPFPGISGKESCSNWNAGFQIDMSLIRGKDEDYWNIYGGCPKAYINYETGKKLWANNFGNATAIRFPGNIDLKETLEKLENNVKPGDMGFRIENIREKALQAASNSVDFSTLFLSLGFFIILSSVILLILVVSTQYESRKEQVATLSALGFGRKKIFRIFIAESVPLALAGSIAGIFTGLLVNNLIIKLLNSVWQGAVQTNTLKAFSDPGSMLTGLFTTVALVIIVLALLLRNQLRRKDHQRIPSGRTSFTKASPVLFAISALATLVLITISIIGGKNTISWFICGMMVFISFLLYLLSFITRKHRVKGEKSPKLVNPSRSYYAHHPARALAPILFLGAGLFTVIITGANRKSFNTDLLTRSSGTGGYLLWGETVTPLIYNMNSTRGMYEYNLDQVLYKDAHFIQVRKQEGNDASCLNLNQVQTPPVLGVDVSNFSRDGAFSFASIMKGLEETDPWDFINRNQSDNTIYGVLDQTVLQWNLMKEAGDTIYIPAEDGTITNIIIAAGLKSSIFQGNIIIGLDNFNRLFPSVSGSNIFLVDGNSELINTYSEDLAGRLSSYGTELSPTYERLASFYVVTNTYLTVFLTLGGFGLVMGVIGLGFVLLRNLDLRKREFALMIAAGFSLRRVKGLILKEHLLILSAGILAGTIPALIATIPSLISDTQVPFRLLAFFILAIAAAGYISIRVTVNKIVRKNLITTLRKE
jgi:putative ABC transport system permease protein